MATIPLMPDSVLAGVLTQGGRLKSTGVDAIVSPMFAFEGVSDAKAGAMKLGFKAMMRIEDHFLAAPRVAFSRRHLSSRLGRSRLLSLIVAFCRPCPGGGCFAIPNTEG